ncbi:MAG: hypothetical protein Ct9H90mP8_1660 [Pseudomonadota bacterium]|nr:MAG: hypothetical protein Ct9H90mP8_1660 [Pseudomonadota bacterium]
MTEVQKVANIVGDTIKLHPQESIDCLRTGGGGQQGIFLLNVREILETSTPEILLPHHDTLKPVTPLAKEVLLIRS